MSSQRRLLIQPMDVMKFIRPLQRKVERPSSSSSKISPLMYTCPICVADTTSGVCSSSSSGRVCGATGMDRHMYFHHATEGVEHQCFAEYNRRSLNDALHRSRRSDAVLIVDLANLDMSASPQDAQILLQSEALRSVLTEFSFTVMVTHEMLIPFSSLIPQALHTLLSLNNQSSMHHQYTGDRLDAGDWFSAATIHEFLHSASASPLRIGVVTRDFGQQTSLQLLFDRNRVHVIAATARQPSALAMGLRDLVRNGQW